ncbi:MAG TPA: penicillin-binding transpeptidase domain-containing protein, partial [Kofleriaceae bacterium]|nr:penicillin-binding transpeptidase domain-containing protein [Kofleriaceae bacterium]
MYYQERRSRRLRRFVLLTALAAAGGVTILTAGGGDAAPSLDVKGQPAPAAAKKRSAAEEKAIALAAEKEAQAAADAAVEAALKAPKLVGDAALRGRIDLDKMEPDGDGYAVPIGDGKRRARLTIDPALQEEAGKLLKRSKAPMSAIVVMAPDGRILALAGRKQGPPSDDSAFELATSAWAPAASVFKLVTASALLDAGVGADDKVCFHGGLRSVMKTNLVDDRRDNRCESLSFAVAESNNAIVGKLAHKYLDGRKIEKAARALGWGSPPSFALAAEPSVITPPSDELEFAQFAAGFWSSQLTALDGALMTGAIATGGMKVEPRIVAEVVDASGARRPVVAGKPSRVMPRAVAEQIGKMMVQTCQSGTAARTFRTRRGGGPLDGVAVAGKTGSLSVDKPRYLGVSWFVAYAPADKP